VGFLGIDVTQMEPRPSKLLVLMVDAYEVVSARHFANLVSHHSREMKVVVCQLDIQDNWFPFHLNNCFPCFVLGRTPSKSLDLRFDLHPLKQSWLASNG